MSYCTRNFKSPNVPFTWITIEFVNKMNNNVWRVLNMHTFNKINLHRNSQFKSPKSGTVSKVPCTNEPPINGHYKFSLPCWVYYYLPAPASGQAVISNPYMGQIIRLAPFLTFSLTLFHSLDLLNSLRFYPGLCAWFYK